MDNLSLDTELPATVLVAQSYFLPFPFMGINFQYTLALLILPQNLLPMGRL